MEHLPAVLPGRAAGGLSLRARFHALSETQTARHLARRSNPGEPGGAAGAACAALEARASGRPLPAHSSTTGGHDRASLHAALRYQSAAPGLVCVLAAGRGTVSPVRAFEFRLL